MTERDTIVAAATANGPAGIGVVRLSGPRAKAIAHALCAVDRPLVARQARYARFRDANGEVIDDGLLDLRRARQLHARLLLGLLDLDMP